MFAWLAQLLGLRLIPRRDGVSHRAAVLALFGRFVDELGSGLPLVLMPTLQARLGLSVAQVGWCLQAPYGAAAVVEPVAAAAIDLVSRRPLLVWGAFGWAAALFMVAGAPSFAWLVAAFLLIGATSGPLAHTTDVLLVEMHPGSAERIGSRQTMLDTLGALLAPAAVAVAGWAGDDPRMALVAAGGAILGYAGALAGTAMPHPGRQGAAPAESELRSLQRVRRNAAEVLRTREARIWLAALFGDTLMDVPGLFVPVWLARDAGASQTMVAVHVAVELLAALAGLALLDRWLRRHDAGVILTVACGVSLLAYPAWLLVPGVVGKLVLIVPLTIAVTPVWPLVRARALQAVPGRGGTVMAVTSVYGALPLAALLGWAAGHIGLAPTMLAAHTAAVLVVLVAVLRRVQVDRSA